MLLRKNLLRCVLTLLIFSFMHALAQQPDNQLLNKQQKIRSEKNDQTGTVNTLSAGPSAQSHADSAIKRQLADNKRLQDQIKEKDELITLGKRLFILRNIIAIVVIILFVMVYRGSKQKTRLNQLLQQQNEDIASQKEEISRQKEELQELNLTKDRLFSVISHDLRSPFASILLTINLIRSGELSAEEQDLMLEDFHRQVTLVNNMANNLLVWATGQQTGIKPEPEQLNAASLVEEIVSISDFLAKSKRVTICNNCSGEEHIMADANHVKIIIQNLIGNAIKFTPPGGQIEIYCTNEGQYEAIRVKDNGIGILPQKMEKLFKVVGKDISGYGTNNEAGAGIGLALIKQFADANNGKLEVKSQPGEGSEFTVYLERA